MWRATPHPDLALPALVALGLVAPQILAAHARRRALATDGGSCGGMAFADAGACGDGGDGGACGDGGRSDGGYSCGSSCGGGD